MIERSGVEDYKLTLRRLALRDDLYIKGLLAEECASPVLSGLDERTHALVRIADAQARSRERCPLASPPARAE